MIYLIAAVVLVGLLCVFDLFLTFAVLRRLRENTAELDRLSVQPQIQMYDPKVLEGTTVPELADGSGERLVAFFEATCDACHEHAPQFAASARGYDSAMAVVSGRGPQAEELLALVGPDVPVTRADEAKALVKRVGLTAFPTFVLVDADGTITRAGTDVSELAPRVPAA
jgi:hypothetical protein